MNYIIKYVEWVMVTLRLRGWTIDASAAIALLSALFFLTLPFYPIMEGLFMLTGVESQFNSKVALFFPVILCVIMIGVCIINYFETRNKGKIK